MMAELTKPIELAVTLWAQLGENEPLAIATGSVSVKTTPTPTGVDLDSASVPAELAALLRAAADQIDPPKRRRFWRHP